MPSVWEAVFMLVVLKIPIVYLCAVVWYAIRAEPLPYEGAPVTPSLAPEPPCDWRGRARRRPLPSPRLRPPRPRGAPGALFTRAEARR